MSVNHSVMSGGIIGIYLRFSLTRRYVVLFSLESPPLMSTHNIPLLYMGRLRKSGGQKNDLISLLLNKFS